MSLLVRKIELGKWLSSESLEDVSKISADAITRCLKTSSNTLSTWKIESIEQLETAVLAMVSGHEHLDKIDIVCLEENTIQQNDLELQQTPGATPIDKYKDLHVDICNLNYSKIGQVASIIGNHIKEEKHKRYTKAKLKKIIIDALEKGDIKIEQLHQSLQEKVM